MTAFLFIDFVSTSELKKYVSCRMALKPLRDVVGNRSFT